MEYPSKWKGALVQVLQAQFIGENQITSNPLHVVSREDKILSPGFKVMAPWPGAQPFSEETWHFKELMSLRLARGTGALNKKDELINYQNLGEYWVKRHLPPSAKSFLIWEIQQKLRQNNFGDSK